MVDYISQTRNASCQIKMNFVEFSVSVNIESMGMSLLNDCDSTLFISNLSESNSAFRIPHIKSNLINDV